MSKVIIKKEFGNVLFNLLREHFEKHGILKESQFNKYVELAELDET